MLLNQSQSICDQTVLSQIPSFVNKIINVDTFMYFGMTIMRTLLFVVDRCLMTMCGLDLQRVVVQTNHT